jgi:hypothetical protein
LLFRGATTTPLAVRQEIMMSECIDRERREFTVAAALALLGGATITVSGCGGGMGSSPTGSSGPKDVSASISANHGHTAVITAAQLMAGGAVHLDLTAASTDGHRHAVDLSADDVVRIRSGSSVSKESTETEAHEHMVSFVAPASGPSY